MADKRLNNLAHLSHGKKYRQEGEEATGAANSTDDDKARGATGKTPEEKSAIL